MPNRCVMYGCTNVSNRDIGISVHSFPKDKNLRRQWVRFVQATRADFEDLGKATAVICSRHFASDSFEVQASSMKEESGFHERCRRLKLNAVPSVNHRNENQRPAGERTAYNKRRKRQIIKELLESESCNSEMPSDTCDILVDDTVRVSTSTIATSTIPIKQDIPFRSKASQTRRRQYRSIGIQVDTMIEVADSMTTAPKRPVFGIDEEYSSDEDFITDNLNDPDWLPDDHLMDLEQESNMEPNTFQSRKFVVYESCLFALFSICQICCTRAAYARVSSTMGTMITIVQDCLSCHSQFKWSSQPMTGSLPDGNISLSSAILFAGALPGKVLNVLRIWGLTAISRDTFFLHQRKYLHAAIRRVWDREQEKNLSGIQGRTIHLAGDARCDSMGHCAKYGSYGILDTNRNVILAMELVQVTEVKNSNAMELEGIKRGIRIVEERGPENIIMVTDQHPQIVKWLREEKPEIQHRFDVWHVTKGLRKKLNVLSAKKNCNLIGDWIKSIINHMHWCAVSSNGDGALAVARWLSILNHLIDVHQHDDPLHPACLHPLLHREWFTPGSEEFEQLSDLLSKPRLLKAIAKLSPEGQTSSLEGYHSTVNHYAPKMNHFRYHAMKSRLQLAALHFNENANRPQALSNSGEPIYNVEHPKFKKGDATVREIKTDCTYGYVDDLKMELATVIEQGITVNEDAPPLICDTFERSTKSMIVQSRRSRYTK